ncbi:hypothetical protein AN944_02948 [Shewanella sp. P1-14-1]|nr:hypothetical protein AN944_02948 [Shewanella sp. P1-14-1]
MQNVRENIIILMISFPGYDVLSIILDSFNQGI